MISRDSTPRLASKRWSWIFWPAHSGAPDSDQHGWRGCWRDNVFIERRWRSVKYEEVYRYAYETVSAVRAGLGRSFTFFNQRRFPAGPPWLHPGCRRPRILRKNHPTGAPDTQTSKRHCQIQGLFTIPSNVNGVLR